MSNLVFLDLETQFSSEEVGGWQNIEKMEISLAVTYDYSLRKFEKWEAVDADFLIELQEPIKLTMQFRSKLTTFFAGEDLKICA